MTKNHELHVLLVEDDSELLIQLKRDLPEEFLKKNINVQIDAKDNFEDALESIKNPHIRYDLVISDTYRGSYSKKDAAVLEMVNSYRGEKFCPVIVYSSGDKPSNLKSSPFIKWVDKVQDRLEDAIFEVLNTGVSQIARKIHMLIDKEAGGFLWNFLDQNWEELERNYLNEELLERIIKRRIALAISDLSPGENTALEQRYGVEYYIYPALDHDYYSLGDVIQDKISNEIRVILTPHCHLFVQSKGQEPRAQYVLTVKTVPAEEIIGVAKLNTIRESKKSAKHKKLKNLANSPAQTERKPAGRHWFLPKFLKIPHLYCDFLQVESIEYKQLNDRFEKLATLLPPYAEAMQECFSSFYGSVGIPNIDPESIEDLVQSDELA